ncbi:thioredoxin fold domain-containing protein [Flavobacterium gelidilacus]|jgi:thioredoxin-related protein|uniref:thioredoxin family protein n=1 Tax=Flavobacterium gelidilacus TaxID=206041 RepID=UPI00047E96F6|nr:thioredoxin fold domain-containing protein [Flavobacterium gelidilacus]
MKKIILVLSLMLLSMVSFAQEIKWMTMDEALKAQEKDPKPIFMDVYTDWCGPCKMLDKNTFHDAAIVEIVSKSYYAVKFNAEGNETITFKEVKYTNPKYVEGKTGRNGVHEFTSFLKVQGYPTMYIFDKDGEIKTNVLGYRTAEQLKAEL